MMRGHFFWKVAHEYLANYQFESFADSWFFCSNHVRYFKYIPPLAEPVVLTTIGNTTGRSPARSTYNFQSGDDEEISHGPGAFDYSLGIVRCPLRAGGWRLEVGGWEPVP
jgi:hypothetical protein